MLKKIIAVALVLTSICTYSLQASSPAERQAEGLEKRYRFYLQEAFRDSPEERYPAMQKAEKAKRVWLSFLKFLDKPIPLTPGATQLMVPENEKEPWPELIRKGKSEGLRENGVPGIWEPKWGESYQSRRKMKKSLADSRPYEYLIPKPDGVSERELRNSHKLQTFTPTVEMQLKMDYHHLVYLNSHELKMTPPNAFAESRWMLWEKVNQSGWKKTRLYGSGLQECVRHIRRDGSYQFAFVLLQHRPKDEQEPHYRFVVDTESPFFSYFNVKSLPEELHFSWELKDEYITERPVTLSVYGEDRLLLLIKSELFSKGEYIFKAPFRVQDVFSADIKAKDRSGNMVFLQKKI